MEGKKENEQFNKRNWLFLLTFFLFTVANIVFSVLCLANTNIAFFEEYFLLFSWLAGGIITLLCGVCVWFTLSEKETLKKTALSVQFLILFFLVLLFILLKTGFFEIIRDADSLQTYLENAGVWMPILYIVLQYFQVILLPIPSVVSTLAGVALFGPFWAAVYSMIGILLGSLTAFFIGRKLGNKAVSWIIGEDTLDKWQQKIKGKDNLFLTVMFILPMFPDDVLCFVAGLSSMSWRYFGIMVSISRLLTISVTCYSLDFIPLNTWWGLMIWGILIIAVVILFAIICKNMNRIQEYIRKKQEKRDKKR